MVSVELKQKEGGGRIAINIFKCSVAKTHKEGGRKKYCFAKSLLTFPRIIIVLKFFLAGWPNKKLAIFETLKTSYNNKLCVGNVKKI